MVDEKILVLTGAGASKSLNIEKEDIPGYFIWGNHRQMPLGSDLLQRLKNFSLKSISMFFTLNTKNILDMSTKSKVELSTTYKKIYNFLSTPTEELKELFLGTLDEYKSLYQKNKKFKAIVDNSKILKYFLEKYHITDDSWYIEKELLKLITLFLILNPQKKTSYIVGQDSHTFTDFSHIQENSYLLDIELSIALSSVERLFSDKHSIIYEESSHTITPQKQYNPKSIIDKIDEFIYKSKPIIYLSHTKLKKNKKKIDCNIDKLIEIYTEADKAQYDYPENNSSLKLSGYHAKYQKFHGLFNFGAINNRWNHTYQPKPKLEVPTDRITKLAEIKNNYSMEKGNELIKILLDDGFLSQNSISGYIQVNNHNFKDLVCEIIYNTSNIKEQNTNNYSCNNLISILKASKLIQKYSPYSIDYFMQNLDFFAENEFSKSKEQSQKDIDNIKKCVKHMIKSILLYHESYIYIDREADNYIYRILWKCNERALLARKSVNEYFLNNTKFITFNYDNTLEYILLDYLGLDKVQEFAPNITHIYGNLNADDKISWQHNENQLLFDCVKKGFSFDTETGIKFIGESKNNQQIKNVYRQFEEANIIYILGFGFDDNNLVNLGLLDDQLKIKTKKFKDKKIFVSGATPSIITKVRKVFQSEITQTIGTLTILENKGNNLTIFASTEYPPKCFDLDFI